MDRPPNLVLFDLDGTLLQTAAVDEECYAQAVADVFGIHGISTDWGSYSDSTDAGILDDLLRQHRGRPMEPGDRAAHQKRFVELLEIQANLAPHRFAPTTGVADLLEELTRRGWTLGIATGGWRPSALLKIRVGGLDGHDLPTATADDARSRERIIEVAAARAMERAGLPPIQFDDSADGSAPRRVVYVGDGLWDLRAAARLGIGFVGVAEGARAYALCRAGAKVVVADFRQTRRVADLIGSAPAALRSA